MMGDDLLTSLALRHVPTNLLASFVKRLARLSLSAPSSALIAVIPLTYNVMRLHPQLMIMIHNPNASSTGDGELTWLSIVL